ncbi:MAG: biopolymer transporter ExbB, partial [Chthoniobacteraceae bacterium]|nr:biopolymer transporter ExbB [Chthoniobacteraceae bacterium]
TEDSKATYDAETVLVYHFSENGAAPVDFSSAGNKADKAGTPAATAIIGNGLRLTGQNSVTVPASASLLWKEGAASTWSAWIKPTAFHADAVLFSRREGGNAFLIGENNGVPFVEVTNAGTTQRTQDGAPLVVNVWRHLAVVAEAGRITLYLNGESYATLNAGLPPLNSPLVLGKDDAQTGSFTGELDELQIAKAARPAGYLKLCALGQSGSESAGKLLVAGKEEAGAHAGGGELMEHLSLFSEISKSLTFDGWVVIGLCTILAVIGWGVALSKFFYLNRIHKATAAFRKQWEQISSDLTALDHSDDQAIKSMGGSASLSAQKLMRESPLFHIYHIGSQEISHRISNARDGFKGLSERSIQAIRVTLDGGLFREVQRLNRNIVFLTIGIAGGPYLGLLGTVIGVMITFAVIAKSGEVEINSIAPGIAGALLATVAGLAVAIPALFAYSYLSARIKDSVGEMHNFIEEFLAKIAEFYPSND